MTDLVNVVIEAFTNLEDTKHRKWDEAEGVGPKVKDAKLVDVDGAQKNFESAFRAFRSKDELASSLAAARPKCGIERDAYLHSERRILDAYDGLR